MVNTAIRDVRPEDVADIHEIFSSQSVIQGTMRLPFQALDYTRERVAPADGVIKLVADLEGVIVGYSEMITYPNVPRHRHVAEINMIGISEAHQGLGIGRQLMEAMIYLADQWLQIRKLSLIVWTDNASAIHLYESLGFVVEGTMTEYAYRAGQYHDAYMMGRTRPDSVESEHPAYRSQPLALAQ